ncbi:MAG: hypothetical protein DMF78_11110 [Acidobacteria bacterium]|nr:MAG: hypothetical protein DMF78_11110 [Acidobacteriota bacterium]
MFPGVHGEDSVARLAHSDTLLLAYQLPLPQALVMAARAVAPDPVWTRALFAAIGAGVAAALAAVVWRLSGPAAGLAAGALAAAHPLLAYYSIVPYQEGPMMLLLLLGADALLDGHETRAGLALGLAALCRYEAWIAIGLVLVGRWAREPTWRRRGRAVVVFGWAPLLWIALWRGLAPRGTYVLDLDPGAARLARLGFLATKLREYSGLALLLLATIGLVLVAWRRDRRWLAGLAYVATTMAAVVMAGHEAPPGGGRVSERLIHLPALAACALGGLALAALATRDRARETARVMAVLVVTALAADGLRRTHALLAEAARDPALRLAVAVAAFADQRLGRGERLGVAAPPVPAAAIADYVRKVERAGGDAAEARRIGLALAARSVDAERVAAQLARPPATVVTTADARPALVAVYEDAPAGSTWPLGPALVRFTAGPRAVTVHVAAPAAQSGANGTR